MLAPANHGSALAKLGKARVGRLKAWFNRIEPGQRILDWLSLGSEGQWQLNKFWGTRYKNIDNKSIICNKYQYGKIIKSSGSGLPTS